MRQKYYLSPSGWSSDSWRDVHSDADIDAVVKNTGWYDTRDEAIADCYRLSATTRRAAIREAIALDRGNLNPTTIRQAR